MRFLTTTVILAIALVLQSGASVTNLKARFQGGKTYITFSEGAGSGSTYNIYRSASPISSVTGLTRLANIPVNSAYDPSYNLYHVVPGSAEPARPGYNSSTSAPLLTQGTGLFVYTPKDTSVAYYAVTVVNSGTEDKSVNAGVNSLNTGVQEKYWPVPQAVLRKIVDSWTWLEFDYEYYMDYSTWADSATQRANATYYKGYEGYGVYYSVYVPPAGNRLGLSKLPVNMWLHSLRSADVPFGFPYAGNTDGMLSFNVTDPNNTFFKGSTADRIIACLKVFLTDPRFDSLTDADRVIMSGSSMGGCGSLNISYLEPGLFSVANPQYGSPDQVEVATIAATPLVDRTPMLDFFGAVDGPAWGIYAHRKYINACETARQGCWAKWFDGGHGAAPAGTPFDDQVPGGVLRFKRTELFPVFTNNSLNNRYGRVDSTAFDPAGTTNSRVDWSSYYHDLGLPKDSIIDRVDSMVITFKALQAGAIADITPRRLQAFKPVAGHPYGWKNQDVATGQIVANGVVNADAAGLITVPAFAIATTGSRLTITANPAASGCVKVTLLDSVSGTPVPGALVTLSTAPASQRTTDSLGLALFTSSTGPLTLSVSRASFVSKSGISVTVPQNDTARITIRLTQLNVTGLAFLPDTAMLGISFFFKPAVFLKYSDNSFYPPLQNLTWSSLPANKVSINASGVVTGLNAGLVSVIAAYQAFSDTLHVTVVDTAAILDSIALKRPAMTIDANAPTALHATGYFRKVASQASFFSANVDSISAWTTGNALKATVSKGVVTGHDSGRVAIVASLSGKTDTCWVTVRPALSFIRRVNFQALPLNWHAAGWTIDCGYAYASSTGLGWVSTSYLDSRSDRSGTNFLLQSFVSSSAPSVYRIDAPDGQYIIRIAVGDNLYGGTDWVACGSDTLIKKDLTRDTTIGGALIHQGKYNKIRDDTIIVSGGAGIRLTVSGCINYLVVISSQGIPMDLAAADDGTPDDAASVERTITASAEHALPCLSAFPNPFNPAVTITYAVSPNQSGSCRIYSADGRVVFMRQIPSSYSGGRGVIQWNGRDMRGMPLAAGFYFGKLALQGGKTLTQRLLLLK